MRWARANERWHARIALFTLVAGCRSVDRTAPADSTRTDDLARQRTAAAIPAAPPIPPPPDVSAAPADALMTKSGVAMKVIQSGGGRDHPSENDCVKVHFTSWKRDGTLFSTSKHETGPVSQCLRSAMEGVADGLKTMVVGEERRLWVPSRLALKPAEPDEGVPSVDLTVDLELVELVRAPPTQTDLLAPPKKALRLPSGLGLLVLKKGQGIEHTSLQGRVTMHFSGWKTDGTLVESTTMGGRPALFEVRELIPGWREGLLRMVVGEKTRLWIPAMLAYGNEPTRRGVPAGPLVYDIELLSLETER